MTISTWNESRWTMGPIGSTWGSMWRSKTWWSCQGMTIITWNWSCWRMGPTGCTKGSMWSLSLNRTKTSTLWYVNIRNINTTLKRKHGPVEEMLWIVFSEATQLHPLNQVMLKKPCWAHNGNVLWQRKPCWAHNGNVLWQKKPCCAHNGNMLCQKSTVPWCIIKLEILTLPNFPPL